MPVVELAEEVILSEPLMIHHTLTIHRWTITIPSAPKHKINTSLLSYPGVTA